MHALCICIALYLHLNFDMNITTYISVLWFALQGLPFLCGKGTPGASNISIFLLRVDTPVPYAFEADTLPVPRGPGSHWHVSIGEKR